MDIQLSRRVQAIKPSPTLAVTNRAAQLKAEGKDIIGLGAGGRTSTRPSTSKTLQSLRLTVGKPNIPPWTEPALKKAIIDKFKRENGLDYQANQILVSCGGKQSFFNLALACLTGMKSSSRHRTGSPYPDMVIIADAVPVIVETSDKNPLQDAARAAGGGHHVKTRFVVINSPPTRRACIIPTRNCWPWAEVLRKALLPSWSLPTTCMSTCAGTAASRSKHFEPVPRFIRPHVRSEWCVKGVLHDGMADWLRGGSGQRRSMP